MPPFMQPAEFRLMWRIAWFRPQSLVRGAAARQLKSSAAGFVNSDTSNLCSFLVFSQVPIRKNPKGLFRDGSRTHSFKSIARFDAVAEHGRSQTPSRQPASMKTVGATKNPGEISPGFCIIQKLKMRLPWRISAAHVGLVGPDGGARVRGGRIAR